MEILSHWIEDQHGRVFALQSPFSIGRSSDNTLVIASDRVSRRHALVQARTQGEFWLTDLDSRNGVFLNRQPLKGSARLKRGDVFQIADNQFVFHAQELSEITSGQSTHAEVTASHQHTVPLWILLADIVGSVRLSQAYESNVWTGKVGAWIGEIREIIEESGGTMSKFLGDGCMSYWSEEHTSADQVRTALEQMRALQRASSLPFRFVIHHGPVQFVGITRGEISMAGTTVNFTFRLEKVASALGLTVVASRAAVEACQGLPNWESHGPQAVPDFSEKVELFSPNVVEVEMGSN